MSCFAGPQRPLYRLVLFGQLFMNRQHEPDKLQSAGRNFAPARPKHLRTYARTRWRSAIGEKRVLFLVFDWSWHVGQRVSADMKASETGFRR